CRRSCRSICASANRTPSTTTTASSTATAAAIQSARVTVVRKRVVLMRNGGAGYPQFHVSRCTLGAVHTGRHTQLYLPAHSPFLWLIHRSAAPMVVVDICRL